MIPVSSFENIQNAIKSVKGHKKGYLTNFFLDIPRIELWVRLDLLEYEEIGETVFFCKKNQDFNNLYFSTTSINSFSADLNYFISHHSSRLYITDIVGKTADISGLKATFLHNGFYQYTSLVRMSRVIEQQCDTTDVDYLAYADKEKGLVVYSLLQEYFDAYAEQLPLTEEIVAWADRNRIIIFSNDEKTVQGFLIFELFGQTSYLRYWFVHPEHREKKIGAKLLRKFFADSNNTRRQLFWVIETNHNAIKRYEHFGFKPEQLFDKILINKDVSYEG